MINIREYLDKKLLIFDGAMGSYYNSMYKGKCELANLYNEDRILEIHKQYIKAGCKAIKTNTFAANCTALNSDIDEVLNVIKKGAQLAKRAVSESGNTECLVFADIGPIPNKDDESVTQYKKIIDAFFEEGINNFLFETFGTDEYIKELSEYIKGIDSDSFIIAQFAVSPDGFTRTGLSGKNIFNRVNELDKVDAAGFNCISGAYHLYEYTKKLERGEKFISVMPNAGYPTVRDNRTIYENGEKYFAEALVKIAENGVSILGGCCGTTPKHMAEAVKLLNNRKYEKLISFKSIQVKADDEKKPNLLMDKLESGKRIIAVELDPPVNAELDSFIEGARRLKAGGVDAITIADCPLARARIDSSILACKLKRELDITPIPHMTCRDRNINATKALLLGMNAEGVENVLVVTGDPVPSELRDEIKTMFSFNSEVLAKHISELNDTVFNNPMQICGALNINARNFDVQLKHALRKIENGVTMFLTQPVLTKEGYDNLKRAKSFLPAKILGGIIPIVSHRNACFMNNEISGINVCDEIINMYEGKDREEAAKTAVEISTGVAEEIKGIVDGYYIITPFKRCDIIEKITANINCL